MSSSKEFTTTIEVVDNLTSSTLTNAAITSEAGVRIEGGLGTFILKSNDAKSRQIILTAPDYMNRTTYVGIPNSNVQKIGLIPNSFDMVSFNRMARNSPVSEFSESWAVGKISRWECGPSITVFNKKMPWSEGSNINSVGQNLFEIAEEIAEKSQNALSTLSTFSATPSIKTPIVGESRTENRTITIGSYTGMYSPGVRDYVGLCYRYMGTDGVMLYAHIALDSGYQTNSNLIAHELGHALGLNHVSRLGGSVMHPNVTQMFISQFDLDSKKIIYDRAILNSIPDIDPPSSGFFGRSGIQKTPRAELEFWLRLRNIARSRGYDPSSTSDRLPTEAITDGYEIHTKCGMDGTEELDVFRVSGTYRERVGGYARRKCSG